ncbi:MAG: excinuclease ABC subunit UvrC [Clostridia bacterium]|nr:excinuclease ABC subunit UvrC [Clostridia bacterium]
MNPHLSRLRKAAMALPLRPGVYIMKDAHGRILYIGKAKALKNRVSQYFGSDANHSPKVRRMVEQVDRFDYLVVGSEFEALVLECSLIKQHRPPYNILLKDDKGYHYVKVTPPPFSRLEEAKQVAEDGAAYIGPYMSGFSVKQSVDQACRLFGLATCRRPLAYGKPAGRPCLNAHIGQCCAPCTGRIREEEYAAQVSAALEYLKQGSEKTLQTLTEQMNAAAERLEFEQAARLRDRIAAIRRMTDKQHVVLHTGKRLDVVAAVREGERLCFQVLRFRDGRLREQEPFIVGEYDDLPAARAEFLRRYYTLRQDVPPRILLDGEAEDADLLAQWLTSLAGRKVLLTVPQKGEGLSLVTLCRDNAAEYMARQQGRAGQTVKALDEIAALLGLDRSPERIECYDISHTGGTLPVAGMVVFIGGKPYRRAYRRFTVAPEHGGDDGAAMAEVVGRRLREYRDSPEDEAFGTLPDLMLLDGGQTQVAAVQAVLRQAGLSVPLYGLVKDGHHRTRAITDGGDEAVLTHKQAAFALLGTIQEEVHRFAITYHRSKRDKGRIRTVLTEVPGIGPSKAKALLQRFGSVAQIKAASVQQLGEVPGISAALAQALHDHLRQNG